MTVFNFLNSKNIPDKMTAPYSKQADQIPEIQEMSAPYQNTSAYMSTAPYQMSKDNSRTLNNTADTRIQTSKLLLDY